MSAAAPEWERLPVDVLLPTAGRPGPLAVTLAGLLAQGLRFRLVVSDQTDGAPAYESEEAAATLRVLRLRGIEVELHWRPERRGVAEQRDFLLSCARSDYVLFLDDDVLLEPGTLRRMTDAIQELSCGFVGMAPSGLTHLEDVRPHEQEAFELWDDKVLPERVRKGMPEWERWRLHNAANVVHLGQRVDVPDRGWVAYKVAWIAACVLFRTDALRAVGGYGFWRELGVNGAGEDVAVQLLMLERFGGAGLLPSGAHHLQVETTLPERDTDGYALVVEAADRR
ncbi:glycosyltransferase family 2 protein [Motilibacter deserti]|uniref:Glycosyltransferase family 2 protein n=1 Tax=Motilibacter deserti TaxID=2714956 RepID=A0ABX0GXR5_9ACTN|nr:glycosyltransferase family 2 protein [Motilibacter deserti]